MSRREFQRSCGVAEVVEYLHSKHEALSLNPSTARREREREFQVYFTLLHNYTPH
jgi:hypothetical protein